MTTPQNRSNAVIRPLVESDLAEADRIFRLAFATFLGLPPDDPRMTSDADLVRTRWKTDPSAVLAAEHKGKFIGSNFATNWGSFAFFGPLTVEPAYWNRGVAQQLLAPTMEIFRRWGSRHLGLYTFANSPKHMTLYQKFGFWPRALVAIMERPVEAQLNAERARLAGATLYSGARPADRAQLLGACREVTDAIFEGLDLQRDIRAANDQKLGETILIWDGSWLAAFAVCHSGPGTEAGTGVCYVKFAAARPNPQGDARASADFARLLDAVEAYARSVGARKITAGVNLARREAFREMFARGFRTAIQGVAMESGGETSGYNRAGVYILDDWR
ncbi:MAG TPA: GNAT family N-acetyltransferase [Candidatus Polarisedimenticolia bacterium]|nr:GNAT family N-acetyltransferase [Candidatus Polarisedimenticolia bacterium]